MIAPSRFLTPFAILSPVAAGCGAERNGVSLTLNLAAWPTGLGAAPRAAA
jgi:hypothetical protein